jgi:hypothetical protein
MGIKASLEAVEKRKILAPTRNQVLIASFTACALY